MIGTFSPMRYFVTLEPTPEAKPLAVDLIDDHLDALADAGGQQPGADRLLMLHQPGVPLGLHLFWHLAR